MNRIESILNTVQKERDKDRLQSPVSTHLLREEHQKQFPWPVHDEQEVCPEQPSVTEQLVSVSSYKGKREGEESDGRKKIQNTFKIHLFK